MNFFGKLQKHHTTLMVIGGLFLICVGSFYQLLFTDEIVNATDILTQRYFWNVFVKENLMEDPCFRTWMPYINAGIPFSGGLDIIFRPVYLLTLLLLPVHIAINYEFVLYILFAGICMYFYMKELELSSFSAFLGSLFFMLSGQVVSLINAGHLNKFGAICFTPLVFWMFERALRRQTLRAFLLASVALGIQFWQGHIQISYYTCIAVGIYYTIRMIILYWHTRNIRHIGRLTVYALVMVVVFLLLSAVTFLPTLSFAQVSDRAEGVSYEFATNWSMPPEELLTYLIPQFFGLRRLNYHEDEQIIPYWGRMPFTQTGHYLGLLPLLFLLLAICFVRNKHVVTLAGLALIILLLGMGKYLPIYKFLYNYIPGFNKFRVPQMILFLFAFAVSGLAGLGLEWFFCDFSKKKAQRLRIFLLVCIGIFMASWLVIVFWPQIGSVLLSFFEEGFLRKGATPEIAAERLKNIFYGTLLFNVLFGCSLFALGIRLAPKIHLRWVVILLILVFVVDMGLFNSKYIDTVSLETSHYARENNAIRYFKENPGLYRVFPTTESPEGYGPFNKFVAHHIFSVSGYEAVGVQYYNEYLRQMGLGTPLVDLLNIKYIILPKDVELNGQTVELGKIVGPYKVVMDSDAVLLENLRYLPRAFPVHNAQVLKTSEEIFAALLHPSFNPTKLVILEESPNVPALSKNIPSAESTVQITHYFNRTIQIKASMAADGFLVLSEKYYPGWKAYVDGQETGIYKANYTLQAIFLPQGEHNVVFAFQPTQFVLGFSITIITGLCLLTIAVVKIKGGGRFFATIHERVEKYLQKIYPFYVSQKMLWGIIGLGIILHSSQYIFNRTLHIDEASLALNIIQRSFSELLQPLDYNQGAPIGFLWIVKSLVQLFGSSEYVLRFFPFITAILSIFLFARISSYYLKASVVPFVLTLFVLSEQLIIYSSTVKQYSSDVFFALLMYTAFIRLQEKKYAVSEIILFCGIGSLALWCSHPSVFILATVGILSGYINFQRKEWKNMVYLSIVCGVWGLTFASIYFFSLSSLHQSEYLRKFWETAFIPFPPRSFSDLLWFPRFLIHFIGYALGLSQAIFNMILTHSPFKLFEKLIAVFSVSDVVFSMKNVSFLVFGMIWSFLYLVAAFFVIVGCIGLFSKNKKTFFLFIMPFCFVFCAAILRKYPMASRLLLFLIPSIVIFIGEGIVEFREIGKRRHSILWGGFIGVLFAYPIVSAGYHLIKPRTDQEFRPVIQYVNEQRHDEDALYVYYGAQGVFMYYAKRFDIPESAYISGIRSRDNWQNYIRDLDSLRGKNRVWLLFSHVLGPEKFFFLEYLDHIRGKQLDAFEGIRASAYLYDLSAASQL